VAARAGLAPAGREVPGLARAAERDKEAEPV
jgi:hypothetical protein